MPPRSNSARTCGHVQGESFQEQHREEQPGLLTGQPGVRSAAHAGLVLGEGDRAVGDVGVAVDVVGVGMVTVVLGDPPAVAEADQQVGVQVAEQAVDALGGGDLVVSGVVPDEPGLGEHHREEGGGHQLPPRLPDQGERGPADGQQEQVRPDLDGVVAGPPLEQPALFHLAGERGVVAAPADGRGFGHLGVPCRTALMTDAVVRTGRGGHSGHRSRSHRGHIGYGGGRGRPGRHGVRGVHSVSFRRWRSGWRSAARGVRPGAVRRQREAYRGTGPVSRRGVLRRC